jgi:phosphate transport system substrate-binding protein
MQPIRFTAKPKQQRRGRALAISGGVVSLSLLATACGGGGGNVSLPTINGAGASFPSAAYQRWAQDYAGETGNQVNYQSVGSGAGVRQFLANSVDFGATDEALDDEEFGKEAAGERGALQIPMLGGTVAVAYNNADCPDLQLTQTQVADVFLGEISDWQELGCPAGPITVAHRSDGSGTTAVFTDSLSCFSPAWKDRVGQGKAVDWPVGVGGKGNEGVAGVLENTPGSIGYVNQAFVRGNIKAAAVQNKEGNFVMPTSESGAAALNGIVLDERLGGTDCNPAGADSYPIAAFTWILAYESGYGAEKAEAVRNFLKYGLGDGPQNVAAELGFVPLKGDVLQKALAEIDKIKE